LLQGDSADQQVKFEKQFADACFNPGLKPRLNPGLKPRLNPGLKPRLNPGLNPGLTAPLPTLEEHRQTLDGYPIQCGPWRRQKYPIEQSAANERPIRGSVRQTASSSFGCDGVQQLRRNQ
jgi:hypothetical protein